MWNTGYITCLPVDTKFFGLMALPFGAGFIMQVERATRLHQPFVWRWERFARRHAAPRRVIRWGMSVEVFSLKFPGAAAARAGSWKWANRRLLTAALVIGIAGLAVNLWWSHSGQDMVASLRGMRLPISLQYLEMLRPFLSLSYCCALIWLRRRETFRSLLRPLPWPGRMTFTNHVVFQATLSRCWLRYFRFGPLEWLWKSLTCGRRQPLGRAGSGGLSVAAAAPTA